MQRSRNSAGILACAAIALLTAAPAKAQVYKCVDARGVTQYADKPCPGGKQVDIQAQPPISGKLESYGSNVGDAERDFRGRQQQRERDEQKEAAAAAARKNRCAQLQAEHRRWTSVARVRVVDSKGEQRYMDDEERAAKIAQLEAGIARECR